jgi:hypothetical protein
MELREMTDVSVTLCYSPTTFTPSPNNQRGAVTYNRPAQQLNKDTFAHAVTFRGWARQQNKYLIAKAIITN